MKRSLLGATPIFPSCRKATKRACGLKKYYGYQNHCGIIFQNIKIKIYRGKLEQLVWKIWATLETLIVSWLNKLLLTWNSSTLWNFENSGAKSFTCRILLEKLVGKLVLLFCVNWREKDANAIVVLIVDFSHKAIAPFHLLPLFTRNGEVKRI